MSGSYSGVGSNYVAMTAGTTGPAGTGAHTLAILYNHKTSIAQGTKASGQTWAATVTFTYT